MIQLFHIVGYTALWAMGMILFPFTVAVIVEHLYHDVELDEISFAGGVILYVIMTGVVLILV